MVGILLAGFVVGLVVSAPLGPMAALAALRWSNGFKRAAIGVAGGVCVGDVVLAALALLMLSVGDRYGFVVPDAVARGVAVVVLGVCGAWLIATASREAKPSKMHGDVAGAVVVTLMYPGNIGAYGVMFLVWLPRMGIDVGDIGSVQALALLLGCAMGVVAGWSLFLTIVNSMVKRYGRPTGAVKLWFSRLVGAVMLAAAAGLLL